jgi:hypothetical protein
MCEIQRTVREQVTRLLSYLTRQGQLERRLVRTGCALAAYAAVSRSGVKCPVLCGGTSAEALY